MGHACLKLHKNTIQGDIYLKKITNVIIKIIIELFILIVLLFAIGFSYCISDIAFLENKNKLDLNQNKIEVDKSNTQIIEELSEGDGNITQIDDWRLILVNNENPLPEKFSVELVKVNGQKEFDARASNELIRNVTSYEKSRKF